MEEEKPKHPYRIMIGDEVMIFRKEWGNNIFYNVLIQKKNADDTKENFYKNVRFKRGVDIPDRTIIRILDMFEDVRKNPKDLYNAIWSLFVLDYEIVQEPVKDATAVINDYNQQISDEADDFFNESVEILESDLPF